jgi:hypothetical protein
MAHPAIGLEKPAIAVAAMKSSKRKALSLPRQFIAEYIAWTNMRQRCHSKNPHYGGRGLSICITTPWTASTTTGTTNPVTAGGRRESSRPIIPA